MVENEALRPLLLDLVEWSALGARPYEQFMDAWRTSCPRLPVWETAVEAGYVRRSWQPGTGAMVEVTPAGLEFLLASGRTTAA